MEAFLIRGIQPLYEIGQHFVKTELIYVSFCLKKHGNPKCTCNFHCRIPHTSFTQSNLHVTKKKHKLHCRYMR